MRHKHVFLMAGVALATTLVVMYFVVNPWESHGTTLRRYGVVVDDSIRQRLQAAAASPKQQWQGLEVPTQGLWDFHGLLVDMDRPATSKIKDKAVWADYNYTNVDRNKVPSQYEAADPVFTYAPALDPLYITVSMTPRVLYFPQLATTEEADYVIDTTAPKLARSQVAISLQNKGESNIQEVRTSKSSWLDLGGPLKDLNKRLISITGIKSHEPMNVLFYGPKQHYDAHHDYFDPARYGKQYSNRMGTFFLYLNDTEAGGSTSVPRANAGRFPANYKEASCQQGLQIFPRKGSAFLLYDMRPDKTFDEFSLHGGCDVEKGTKWGGVVWYGGSPSQSGKALLSGAQRRRPNFIGTREKVMKTQHRFRVNTP